MGFSKMHSGFIQPVPCFRFDSGTFCTTLTFEYHKALQRISNKDHKHYDGC